jgi:hypothetical protein
MGDVVCHFIIENSVNNILCACGRRFTGPDAVAGFVLHRDLVSTTGNPNVPVQQPPAAQQETPPTYNLGNMTRR